MEIFAIAAALYAAGIITGLAFARAARSLEDLHDVFDDAQDWEGI